MGPQKRSSAISATELMAELESDPEYQRQIQEDDAEREAWAQKLDQAERPIVGDLRSAGVDVDSVWDLVNTSEPYPNALPVLIQHLELGGYPDRVMESLGRSLAVKPASLYWTRLQALYQAPRSLGEQEGVAVALAACATSEHLEELINFLGLDERGDSRIYFIRPILKVGGAHGRRVVERLRTDQVFGEEATALLDS